LVKDSRGREYYRWDLNYTKIWRLNSYGVTSVILDDDKSFSLDTPELNSGDIADIGYETSNYTIPLLMPIQT
jgi:hypothetical protein